METFYLKGIQLNVGKNISVVKHFIDDYERIIHK